MKKIIALLLTLTMVFCLFAGCGSQGKTPASPTDPVTPPAVDTPDEPSVPDEPAQPEEPEVEEPAGVDLTILYERDDSMINNYSVIALDPLAPFVDADGNPVSDVYVNTVGADALINWLLSDAGKTAASNYGFDQYGEYLFYWKDNAPVSTTEIVPATEENKIIRLSTTTSVNDSGLLAYILPMFEEATGYTVEVTSAGTGKAIANAKAGNADLILVHSKSQEEAFIEGGFGRVVDGFEAERLTFMYNYFVLCGPSADPAGVKDAATVKDAFAAIAAGKYIFVSRGDKSGTHTKEISLWAEDLGITAEPESVEAYQDWYQFSNAGMGVCLTMAEELGGYILSDKATVLTFQANNGVIG